jgi:ABC-2 type transport system permease protein
LLVSRLPDQAILLGKLSVSIACAWAMTLVILLISMGAVNVLHWEGRVMVYEPGIALAHMVVSLLMSAFVAGVGILISLRSPTVQGAQQTLFGALLVPLTLLQFVPLVMLSVVPNGSALLKAGLERVGSPSFAAVVLAVWLAIDVALLAVTALCFRRARLILG